MVSLSNTAKALVLGSNLDFGAMGSVTVTDLYYDTDTLLTWYTFVPRNPGAKSITNFMSGPGVGEPMLERLTDAVAPAVDAGGFKKVGGK